MHLSHLALDQFPGTVGIKNQNFEYLQMNPYFAKLSGFKHVEDVVGVTDDQLVKSETHQYFDLYREQDQRILAQDVTVRTLQIFRYADQHVHVFYGVKKPLLNEQGVTEAIIGYGFEINEQVLHALNGLESRYTARHSGCFREIVDHYENQDACLTERETECLYYLSRSMTNKEIAQRMILSVRTIEWYVDQIKEKFGCGKKSHIVEYAIDQGLLNIIPTRLFKRMPITVAGYT